MYTASVCSKTIRGVDLFRKLQALAKLWKVQWVKKNKNNNNARFLNTVTLALYL